MGIGGIESGIASSNVRSTTKIVPEISPSAAVAGVSNEGTRIVQGTNASHQEQGFGAGQQGENANYGEGVPIQEVSKEKVENALREINTKIRPTHTECQFSYHEDTKRISIKVLDQQSGEVIREIPPEKTLDMIARTLELAGILVDEKR